MASAETYDFFDPSVLADPHAFLHRLRAEQPLYFSRQFRGWVLTRYADALAAGRDERLISPPGTDWWDGLPARTKEQFRPARDSIRLWAGLGGEQDHRDFQGALRKYFTPSRLEALRPRIQRFTDELLDAARERGTLEVVQELARPLPARVIGELLGVPPEDHGLLLRWSSDLLGFFQRVDLEGLHRGQHSLLEMREYLRPLIAERRRAPREDLLSVLVSQDEGFFAREPEAIVANATLLLFAGHETTSHLLSSGLYLLLTHPDQLALLREEPERMAPALEEMLRYDGASDAMVRVSREPLELGGRRFFTGERFILVYKAANHDPQVFPEPQRFDITRRPNRHLALGAGNYYCLGAALARLQGLICFQTLLERMPRLRPAQTAPEWRPLPPLGRRLGALPVAF